LARLLVWWITVCLSYVLSSSAAKLGPVRVDEQYSEASKYFAGTRPRSPSSDSERVIVVIPNRRLQGGSRESSSSASVSLVTTGSRASVVTTANGTEQVQETGPSSRGMKINAREAQAHDLQEQLNLTTDGEGAGDARDWASRGWELQKTQPWIRGFVFFCVAAFYGGAVVWICTSPEFVLNFETSETTNTILLMSFALSLRLQPLVLMLPPLPPLVDVVLWSCRLLRAHL